MLTNMLDLTADIESVSYTQNSMGKVRSYSTRISSEPCSLKIKSGTEEDQYGKNTNRYIYRFYFEYNSSTAAITESDVVNYSSVRYRIININDVAGKNEILHVDAERIE